MRNQPSRGRHSSCGAQTHWRSNYKCHSCYNDDVQGITEASALNRGEAYRFGELARGQEPGL